MQTLESLHAPDCVAPAMPAAAALVAGPDSDRGAALAATPTEGLPALPMLQPDQITDPLRAYQVPRRGNALRVTAETVLWGKRGAWAKPDHHGGEGNNTKGRWR